MGGVTRYVLGYRMVNHYGMLWWARDDRYDDLPCSDYSYAGLYDSWSEAKDAGKEKVKSDEEHGWETVYEVFDADTWDAAHANKD